MELLFATRFIALHASAHRRSRTFTNFRTNVTRFAISFLWNQLQNYRFHRRHIPETHLRYVKCTYDVCPALIIRSLEGTIPRGTKFTPDSSRTFLTFTLAAVPRTTGDRHYSVARLVHSNRTTLTIAVDQRVLRPTPIIGANTATTDHLLHSGPWSMEIHCPSTDLLDLLLLNFNSYAG